MRFPHSYDFITKWTWSSSPHWYQQPETIITNLEVCRIDCAVSTNGTRAQMLLGSFFALVLEESANSEWTAISGPPNGKVIYFIHNKINPSPHYYLWLRREKITCPCIHNWPSPSCLSRSLTHSLTHSLNESFQLMDPWKPHHITNSPTPSLLHVSTGWTVVGGDGTWSLTQSPGLCLLVLVIHAISISFLPTAFLPQPPPLKLQLSKTTTRTFSSRIFYQDGKVTSVILWNEHGRGKFFYMPALVSNSHYILSFFKNGKR